ncbi:O-antigen polymerase [Acinetobacter johnsonii]|uniref:O-antigen polymerase n=1 Tax=Acinetobacter johnsonii TaxID=40214 RepID=UPI002FDAD9FF|nr:O-antigen polymerase [Acinetobacter johnsonii]
MENSDFWIYSNFSTKIIYIFTFVSMMLYVSRSISKRGLFSIENYFILFYFLIPILLMAPFAYSSYNLVASGDFLRYRYLINDSISISCFGILSWLIGTFISRGVTFSNLIIPKRISSYANLFWFGFNNKYIKILMFFLVFLCIFYFLSLGVNFGEARGYGMENRDSRPLINFFSAFFGFFFLYYLIFASVNKKIINLIAIFFLIVCSLFFGTRSSVVVPLIYLFFLINFVKDTKINFFSIIKIIFAMGLVIYLIVIISNYRDQANISILFSILYGNNFSDIRDFAWVLYGWKEGYLYGKTELAGVLSFIPSTLSDFRQTWSWGVYSTEIADLDPTVHPGLRPGFFGESYINFGLVGVFVLGFFSGFLIHQYDTYIYLKKLKKENFNVVKLYAFGNIYLSIISYFAITAGFSTIYVILSIGLVFYLLKNTLTFKQY